MESLNENVKNPFLNHDYCRFCTVYFASLNNYCTQLKRKRSACPIGPFPGFIFHTIYHISLQLNLNGLSFSSGQLTGPNPRWGRQPLSCRPTAARLEPDGGGRAAGSVRRVCGPNVESVTFVRTWRSLVDRGAWSSPASWGSALQ